MNLIQIAQAQDLDEIASPTIPFEPIGGNTPTPSVVVGPSISLQTQQLGIGVGEKIKVQVVINTRGKEVKAYGFQITFNPEFVSVQDANINVANIQVDFKDTFFTPSENIANSQNGTISVKASAAGSATITDRVVVEFELLGLKEGLSQVEIVKTNSSLTDSNNLNILESTNSLAITVSKQGQPTTNPTPSVFPTRTPGTALINDVTDRTLFVGLLLISAGLVLWRKIRNAKISG